MPARKGAAHHLAVLTDEIVRDARKQYRQGGVTIAELAEEYGCKRTALSRAIHGNTWAHLKDYLPEISDAA
jgi:transposase-like protein